MSRMCIMCPQAARANEHTFPAVLGGRRTSRAIYCPDCENALAPINKIIAPQLRMINALLGVRPDHDDSATVMDVTDASGRPIRFSVSGVERTDSLPYDPDGKIIWHQGLGGPEGFRAVAYVALNFFAVHFPIEVRQTGIATIKSFVRGEVENTGVWWEREHIAGELLPNPFEFGHTINLSINGSTGEAFAIVSFFGALTFGIFLGTVTEPVGRTTTIFINPHADTATESESKVFSSGAHPKISKPEPLQAYLIEMVEEKGEFKLFQQLVTRIEAWAFNNELADSLERLNEAGTLCDEDREALISSVVSDQTRRIYKMMKAFVGDVFSKENCRSPTLRS